MTTRSGVENTVIYDPARIWERYGLRPDQMIDYKALKGDPTDNIPGVPGRGREDRREAHRASAATSTTLYARIDEVKPDKLREKLRRASRGRLPRPDLTTIVRELPVDPRPRCGAARRLRPRDGHPALPRVRVPDADRAPAGDVRRERGREGPGAARGRDQRHGRRRRASARSGRRAGDRGRPIRAGLARRRGPAALARLRHGLAAGPRRRAATATRRRRRRDRDRPRRRSRSSTTCRPRSGRRSPIPGRIEVLDAGRPRGRRGLARRAVGRRRVDRLRRPAARGAARAQAFAVAGRDGRVVAGWGTEAADGAPAHGRGPGPPARRARGEADPRRALRGGPGGARHARSSSIPRSRRTS